VWADEILGQVNIRYIFLGMQIFLADRRVSIAGVEEKGRVLTEGGGAGKILEIVMIHFACKVDFERIILILCIQLERIKIIMVELDGDPVRAFA